MGWRYEANGSVKAKIYILEGGHFAGCDYMYILLDGMLWQRYLCFSQQSCQFSLSHPFRVEDGAH